MCDFYQHPSAPFVLHDPRDPLVQDKYDTAPTFDQPSEAEMELLAVTDGLTVLIQRHGAARIMRLVRLLAAHAGQEV